MHRKPEFLESFFFVLDFDVTVGCIAAKSFLLGVLLVKFFFPPKSFMKNCLHVDFDKFPGQKGPTLCRSDENAKRKITVATSVGGSTGK